MSAMKKSDHEEILVQIPIDLFEGLKKKAKVCDQKLENFIIETLELRMAQDAKGTISESKLDKAIEYSLKKYGTAYKKLADS